MTRRPGERPHPSGGDDGVGDGGVGYFAGDDDGSAGGDGDEPVRVERKRPGWIGDDPPIRHLRLRPPNLVNTTTDRMSSYRLHRHHLKNYLRVPSRRSRFQRKRTAAPLRRRVKTLFFFFFFFFFAFCRGGWV